MLRIRPGCVEMLKDVAPLVERIRMFDRDMANQLRRSSLSVHLNVSEGTGNQGGTRRARYSDALGSARETVANLEAAYRAMWRHAIEGDGTRRICVEKV